MTITVINEYQHFLTCVAFLSTLSLFIGLLIMPFFIATIPDDYFKQTKRPSSSSNTYSITRFMAKLFKNLLGLLLILSGIAMLILPGQGLLTLFIGILLIDYPGKYPIERKLISYPVVFSGVNWIRRKQKKAPFTLSSTDEKT